PGHRFATPAFRPDAGQIEAIYLVDACARQRLAVAVAAEPDRLEPVRSGEMGDAPATEADEVLSRQCGATLIVGQEAIGVRVVDPREHMDQWYVARRDHKRFAHVGPPRRNHDAVDAFSNKLFDVPRLALVIVSGIGHEYGDAAVGEAFLQSLHDRH